MGIEDKLKSVTVAKKGASYDENLGLALSTIRAQTGYQGRLLDDADRNKYFNNWRITAVAPKGSEELTGVKIEYSFGSSSAQKAQPAAVSGSGEPSGFYKL